MRRGVLQLDSPNGMMAGIADEQTAIDALAAVRRKARPSCPYCARARTHRFRDGRTNKCGDCRKRFSVKVGTIFETGKLPLQRWLLAILLVTAHGPGVASTRLDHEIGVTRGYDGGPAWRVAGGRAGVGPSNLTTASGESKEERTGMLTWSKTLARTDAQQETTGGLVPYLRLTKSSLTSEDFQTWFRDRFFQGVAFVPGIFGKEQVEIAKVPFEVTVRDLKLGTETLTVTHGRDREKSHNTPNTWLHWTPRLLIILQLNDLTGRVVRLTRDEHGAFHLDIDSRADAGS